MIKERMSGLQATVIDGGMVDSPEKAAQTAEVLKSEDIEILFIFISTYALSSTILPIPPHPEALRAGGLPPHPRRQ